MPLVLVSFLWQACQQVLPGPQAMGWSACLQQCNLVSSRSIMLGVAGACGLNGVCLSSPSFTKNTAPRIQLNTTIVPATFNLTFGTSYTACGRGVVPSLAKPCEPGASASDQQDGNITSKVVACPSAGCTANATLCTGMPCTTIFCKQLVTLLSASLRLVADLQS